MGYLHAGHIELVKQIRSRCDVLIASIFVNPTQFGPNEDFSRYPRDEAHDVALLEEVGVDVVFTPEAATVYPPGFQTYIDVGSLSEVLCGKFRPVHFRGVATIVLKLFRTTHCDIAIFGLKDFQQAAIISRMVADLNLEVELILSPTVRELDGLAMSSRNKLLSEIERKMARAVPRALEAARVAASLGEQKSARLADIVRRKLESDPSILIQYIEIVDPVNLHPVERIGKRSQLAVAVFVGKTRLIDNVAIGPEGDPDRLFEEQK